MSGHLGARVSELVDDELDPAARERALAHVTRCRRCADEVRAVRAARRALCADLPGVVPDPDFMTRLLALQHDVAGAGEQPSGEVRDRQPLAPPPGPGGSGVPGLRTEVRGMPAGVGALRGDVRRAARRRWVAWGTGSALLASGVAASGLLVLGQRPVVVPDRVPAAALSVLASAPPPRATSPTPGIMQAVGARDELPGSDVDVLSQARADGWQCPLELPAGVHVAAIRIGGVDEAVLELDLEGPAGRAVVREQKGRLDLASVEDAVARTVDGAPVYVLSTAPLHVVWQSGENVVDLVAETSLENVLQLISSFSVDEFDTRVQAQLVRGWSSLTGGLS